MRMLLTGLRSLEMQNTAKPEPREGFKLLKVQYCAICRTDAKMWHEGHKDLVFPRVPGHELVAGDAEGKMFTVWPGVSCGACAYCRSGRENLCEHMKIMGFHNDGGFADYVLAPENSLIAVPEQTCAPIACFAEPTGCVINALDKLKLKTGERMVIYGGGALGLIAALVCLSRNAVPLIIEKNEEKIDKANAFLEETGIQCRKDTTESEFDAALNACPDPIAFNLSTVKLGKGGRLSFFSGLTKNQNIKTNIVNLMHYKEIELFGAYGLKRSDMAAAVDLIRKNPAPFEKLIEKFVSPQQIPDLLPDVLAGKSLKYIIDFTGRLSGAEITASPIPIAKSPRPDFVDSRGDRRETSDISDGLSKDYQIVTESIRPVVQHMRPSIQQKIDNKTKPLGSLGKLEALALQLGLIQNTLNPRIERKHLFIFAADHGIAEEGVSAFPTEVTAQMVKNFLEGGAAINVLCRQYHIDIQVVDMGVRANFADHPGLRNKKIRMGTRNFAVESAMTTAEAKRAVESGMDIFLTEHANRSIDIVGLGEMGIGNTTSASAIISAITGITPAEATGRGTGIDDKGVQLKAEIIERALRFHNPDPENGLEILQKIGGYEIAGIVGAILAAASKKTAIVLDGVISTAAGLIAFLINPDIQGYLISGHKSTELAQKAALSYLRLEPVIDFQMRLGEGTGAALAMSVAESAARIMREMASFEKAGVSNRQQEPEEPERTNLTQIRTPKM
jgi:nicotinate-nucleotide--dimethylbenzimidazole phosphoribosyltransferase